MRAVLANAPLEPQTVAVPVSIQPRVAPIVGSVPMLVKPVNSVSMALAKSPVPQDKWSATVSVSIPPPTTIIAKHAATNALVEIFVQTVPVRVPVVKRIAVVYARMSRTTEAIADPVRKLANLASYVRMQLVRYLVPPAKPHVAVLV